MAKVCFLATWLLLADAMVIVQSACTDGACSIDNDETDTENLLQTKVLHEKDVGHGSQFTQGIPASAQHDLKSNFLDVFLHNGVASQSQADRCLNFLHIPKNAGSSIEVVVEQQSGITWGHENKSLDCSHTSLIHKSGSKTCLIHNSAGKSGTCSVWHVPPVFDPVVAAGYEGCTTFCISRHPLTKVISQYLGVGGGGEGGMCNVEEFREHIKTASDHFLMSPFTKDCHYVPQVEYIGQGKFCQRVLRYENLDADFNALMAEYNLPITLAGTHANRAKCDLSKHLETIPLETLEKIETMYAADYRELGYERFPAKA